MINLYVIIGLLAVCAIGFWRINSRFNSIAKNILFLREYRKKLIELANDFFKSSFAAARSTDPALYHWLVLNVNKAQRITGTFGVGTYIAPFNTYQITNCHFLVDLIPNFSTGRISQQEVSLLDTVLTRAMGHYLEADEACRKDFANPLKWFQYGVRAILSLPIRILHWLGIISNSAVEHITTTSFFKVIAGTVALISFVSSVVGLIGGWQPFMDTLHKWLQYFFK